MRKIQIQFDGRALAMLDALRSASGRRTIADVIRDALSFYDWCRRQVADGYVIAAVKGDHQKEVVMPFAGGE